jgi:aryl-alcohol dehydrogenase-like predicted oxidoreductase
MEYRALGPTGLKVSEICLGTMQWRWTATESASFEVMDAFFDAGGNFLDTADIYSNWVKGLGGGSSETVIGKWLKRRENRKQIVLATKCRGRMWDGPTGEGLGRAHIVKACEDSLKRLQTDHIDLYQSHWSDPGVPIEETLGAYRDLIRAGKVRYIGCSNYTPSEFAEALVAGRHGGYPRYVSLQPFYNLLSRELEHDHVWLIKKYNVAVIPYSPLAGGFLTGKYRKGRPAPRSKRASGLKWAMNDRGFGVIGALESMGRKRGKTVAQMALAWLLSHDWMTAPIVGANSVDQLKENVGASGLKLSAEELAELGRLTS